MSAAYLDTYDQEISTLASELVRAVRAERDATADARIARVTLLGAWAPGSAALRIDGATVAYVSATVRQGALDAEACAARDASTCAAVRRVQSVLTETIAQDRIPAHVRSALADIARALADIGARHADQLPRKPDTTVAATIVVRDGGRS